MTKDKAAQLEIRRDEFHTKAELRQLIKWLQKVTRELDDEAKGLWLVSQKQYAPLFRFSLMK